GNRVIVRPQAVAADDWLPGLERPLFLRLGIERAHLAARSRRHARRTRRHVGKRWPHYPHDTRAATTGRGRGPAPSPRWRRIVFTGWTRERTRPRSTTPTLLRRSDQPSRRSLCRRHSAPACHSPPRSPREPPITPRSLTTRPVATSTTPNHQTGPTCRSRKLPTDRSIPPSSNLKRRLACSPSRRLRAPW